MTSSTHSNVKLVFSREEKFGQYNKVEGGGQRKHANGNGQFFKFYPLVGVPAWVV